MQPGFITTIQSDSARHADDTAVSVYTAYNDSHWNAHKYQIDSQASENTSHFAMRCESPYVHHWCVDMGMTPLLQR